VPRGSALALAVRWLGRSRVLGAADLGGGLRQWLFYDPKIVVVERQGDG
jgi:hypothetical protein